jgi:type III pantothenate kinase
MAMKDDRGRMVLGFDIGNTRTNIGLFENDHIIGHWRISSLGTRAGDEYWVYLREFLTVSGVESIDGVVIGSVVPRLTRTYTSISRERLDCEPVLINGQLDLGIRLCVDRPEEVGADRIANSVAASTIWQRDVIVVDLGTATTFDVVSKEKEYLGGVIAPGIETSAARLFEKTAKLPQVEFLEVDTVIGKNTEEAIRSGIFFGAISQIDGIVRRIVEEWKRSPFVIATGGLAEMASSSSETIVETDPFLTLKGLQICDSILMKQGG